MDVVVVEELSDGEGTVEEASGAGTDARLVVVADVSVPGPLVVGAVSWRWRVMLLVPGLADDLIEVAPGFGTC